MHSIGYTDERNTHSFAACCSAFFWQLQSPHHTTSTARFWQKTLRKPSNATRARQNAAPGRLLPGGVRDELRSKVGFIDRILNEWCDPFVSAARLNEWFATNFGAADELTADYRTRRRRAADSGGAGRTATGIGREKGVERLLLGRGLYLATPTSARNAPSDTPGDRARARHCVSGFFCVRDDLAEITAIKGRG